jgi:integrase
VLLAQTGGRTYTEGFSLRWDQIDLENSVIYFGGQTKTEGSSEPVPLTKLARDVLVNWKKEQADKSQFLFPSPIKPDQPITSVRRAWKTTLRNAEVAYFPIYNLRHVFCTRLSWVAPDTVVQRAMRHSSPETKRRYQLGMVEQVRQNLEKANKRVYGRRKVLRFHDVPSDAEIQEGAVACKWKKKKE